jgi:TIR domain
VADEEFQGFFSYTHLDAEIDPALVDALTSRLEKRVTRKVINARFSIWRDVNNLRTGERWDDRIGDAVRASRVFIVLMTPKWFESAYCRKEYQLFKQVEEGVGVGEYVVPLLAHTIEKQIKNFDRQQKETYDDLNTRQYKKTIAADFLALTEDQREGLVDQIADDIESMIERLRNRSSTSDGVDRTPMSRRSNREPEFRANPHNFPKYDFVTTAEVLVEPHKGQGPRGVFVHLGFLERLYVKTKTDNARVEFSIRRAYLSIDDGAGKLARNPGWAQFSTSGSVYYVNEKAAPQAITICINPQPGRTGISDLPLPPAEHENFLSMPAIAAPDTDIRTIRAELTVSLCPEGLFIVGEDVPKPSAAAAKKIAAIVSVLAGKDETAGSTGLIRRRIPVSERR